MTRRLQSGLYKELLTSALEAEIDARTAEGWWVNVRPADATVRAEFLARHVYQLVRRALECQRRRKNVPARRRKDGPRARRQLVPVVHGRAPRAGRRALGAAGGGPRVGGARGPTGTSGGLFGRLPAS